MSGEADMWEGEGGALACEQDEPAWFLLRDPAAPVRPFVAVEPFRLFRLDPSEGTYANAADLSQPITLDAILEASREVDAAGQEYWEEASAIQIEQIRAVVERLRETGSAVVDLWLRDRLRFAPPFYALPFPSRIEAPPTQTLTMRMPRPRWSW